MKIIKKYNKNDFSGYTWLNFDSLSKSDGYKLEVYLNDSKDIVSDLIVIFHELFGKYKSEILVSDFKPDGKWGDFCLDTWDIESEKSDYSPDNKQEPTASYLAMLRDSGIEPIYSGFCKCLDWDKFLNVMLHCVLQHTAPYSMMFYVPDYKFVFYFHHTASLGIYYKELNVEIKHIIKKAQEKNMEIKNFNDDRLISLVNPESGSISGSIPML